MNARHLKLLREFISLPTAPFAEAAPLNYIRRFVEARPALRCRADRFGNLHVRYVGRSTATPRPPIVFAGHLDHPGFVTRRSSQSGRVEAEWRGWVERRYFPNARVRLFVGRREVRGRIIAVDDRGRGGQARRAAESFGADSPPHRVWIRVPRGVVVPPGTIGMWDLPVARITGTRLWARACDDVAGVAAILCALDELCRSRAAGSCAALFTRAEEVGFGGALAAVSARELSRRSIVVAVECSRAITGVAVGGGPVLRVGDKASVFTPAATAFCQVVAERLASDDKSFAFQRKLMDGGTCESTVYCHWGYDATGLCLPLVNYHNRDLERGRIAPESIDLRDFENLVKWFVALATTRVRYTCDHPGLDRRLTTLLRKHRPRLLKTRRNTV